MFKFSSRLRSGELAALGRSALGQLAISVSIGIFMLAAAAQLDTAEFGGVALSYTVLGSSLVVWRNGILTRAISVSPATLRREIRIEFRIVGLLAAASVALTGYLSLRSPEVWPIALVILSIPVLLFLETLRFAVVSLTLPVKVLPATVGYATTLASGALMWLLTSHGAWMIALWFLALAFLAPASIKFVKANQLRPNEGKHVDGSERAQQQHDHQVTKARANYVNAPLVYVIGILLYAGTVSALFGLSAWGLISLATLAFFPISVLIQSVPLSLASIGSSKTPIPGGRITRRLGGPIAFAAIAWGSILWLAWPFVSRVMNDDWAAVRGLLPIQAAIMAAFGIASIMSTLVLIDHKTKFIVVMNGVQGILRLVLVLLIAGYSNSVTLVLLCDLFTYLVFIVVIALYTRNRTAAA